jgi:uridine phosphorylase
VVEGTMVVVRYGTCGGLQRDVAPGEYFRVAICVRILATSRWIGWYGRDHHCGQ